MFCYLDNAATTKPSENVVEAVNHVMIEEFGNPSSLHGLGVNAERIIKESKANILKLVKDRDGDILFTSGGTESNNLALLGAARAHARLGKHIITTSIEHKSVLNACKQLEEEGFEISYLKVDNNGIIDFEDFKSKLRDDTILVSIMHVNNETGSIQPVELIGQYISKLKKKPIYHIDAVQSFSKLRVSQKSILFDLLSISGHKVYAPKGIGALYMKKGTKLKALVFGGQQGSGIRPGTENILGITGINQSIKDLSKDINENYENVSVVKKRFLSELKSKEIQYEINCDVDNASPYIVNLSFDSIRGEVLLHSLEADKIFVSTGSACNSANKLYSHVLTEMKMSESMMEGAIRFSFSTNTTKEEIDYAVEKIAYHVNYLLSITRRK
ncbi:MAG: cysteine desulfurase family protein [Acidaminobacteraceae bacterium]